MFFAHYLDLTRRKLKENAANIITLINLSLGCISIFFTLKGTTDWALIMIFVAALADRLDGMVARKLRIESEIGKQLDSLCDLVSFGVAPATLIYVTSLSALGYTGMFFCIIFIICGGYRLARFNITENHGFFQGLPITAAGCILTFFALFTEIIHTAIFIILTVVLSLAMISSTKIKKM
ncbi:MAG TPA: CDP-diacylglycerol--serine O-phosphatidyltransferase [Firmicutes bacterium]|nr:CDP-diacylglycerol--serine O-phosphatidyltransferase [Bacillales bacterium]HJA41262.1 CDP-diacylglycerol--serine O-phosphatidyltransferase [Bacillota bacterium]